MTRPSRWLAPALAVLAVAAWGPRPGVAADPISEEAARLELSRTLRDDERMTEAVAEYRRLIADLPARTDLRVELAEVYLAQDDPEAANEILEPVDPTELDARGQRLVASLAIERKDYDVAVPFPPQLEADPANDELRLETANVLTWAKRYDEAVAEFRTLLARHSEDVQLRRKFAQALGWAGRREEAITEWKRSLGRSDRAE